MHHIFHFPCLLTENLSSILLTKTKFPCLLEEFAQSSTCSLRIPFRSFAYSISVSSFIPLFEFTYTEYERERGQFASKLERGHCHLLLKFIKLYKLAEVPSLVERMAALMCVDINFQEDADGTADDLNDNTTEMSAEEILASEICRAKELGKDELKWLELEELNMDDDKLLALDLPHKCPVGNIAEYNDQAGAKQKMHQKLQKVCLKTVLQAKQWNDSNKDKYEQLKAGTDVQAGSEADDHIFFKACGGWSEKGNVYGLGRESPTMYERSAKRGSARTSSTCSPSFVAQIQGRLRATEEELRSTRDELEATKKYLENQRLALLALNTRFESFSSLLDHPSRADHSEPSS